MALQSHEEFWTNSRRRSRGEVAVISIECEPMPVPGFVQDKAEHGNQPVATVDCQRHSVWRNPSTGKTRKPNPIAVWIGENLTRERQKAEERLEEHPEKLHESCAWDVQGMGIVDRDGLEELASSIFCKRDVTACTALVVHSRR
mmetsp:Transcript_24564/g.82236  ORF Transcript_24564/g.82236 Transcript_24564/m.82236 type:complete len:144 (-) Transcript_24564:210-641(-)